MPWPARQVRPRDGVPRIEHQHVRLDQRTGRAGPASASATWNPGRAATSASSRARARGSGPARRRGSPRRRSLHERRDHPARHGQGDPPPIIALMPTTRPCASARGPPGSPGRAGGRPESIRAGGRGPARGRNARYRPDCLPEPNGWPTAKNSSPARRRSESTTTAAGNPRPAMRNRARSSWRSEATRAAEGAGGRQDHLGARVGDVGAGDDESIWTPDHPRPPRPLGKPHLDRDLSDGGGDSGEFGRERRDPARRGRTRTRSPWLSASARRSPRVIGVSMGAPPRSSRAVTCAPARRPATVANSQPSRSGASRQGHQHVTQHHAGQGRGAAGLHADHDEPMLGRAGHEPPHRLGQGHRLDPSPR